MVNSEHDRSYEQPILPDNSPQRERLSDPVVDDYLSFLGNSEVKIATLVSMDPNMAYSALHLYEVLPHQFIQTPPDGAGWQISTTLPYAYCDSSFIPVGLVERRRGPSERFATKTANFYQKTGDGTIHGDELGGLLLHFSSNHNTVSLHQLLGSTNSSAEIRETTEEGERRRFKRQPAIRKRFFQHLLNERTTLPTRVIDVATTMHEYPPLIGYNAKSLGEQGIITFTSIKRGSPISAYRFSSTEPEEESALYKENYFPHLVYETLKANPQRWWTIEEITDLLLKTRPSAIVSGTDENSRRANMQVQAANILSGLRDRGHAEVENFDRSFFSRINLEPSQRALLDEFLVYIDAFQNQDPQALAFGRAFAQQLRNNPQALAQLILKGRDVSPNAGKNATTTEATALAIDDALQTHSDITVSQLRQILQNEHGISLSEKGLKVYLRKKRNEGEAISHPSKSGARWRSSTR